MSMNPIDPGALRKLFARVRLKTALNVSLEMSFNVAIGAKAGIPLSVGSGAIGP